VFLKHLRLVIGTKPHMKIAYFTQKRHTTTNFPLEYLQRLFFPILKVVSRIDTKCSTTPSALPQCPLYKKFFHSVNVNVNHSIDFKHRKEYALCTLRWCEKEICKGCDSV
jgi:hypothetical protein